MCLDIFYVVCVFILCVYKIYGNQSANLEIISKKYKFSTPKTLFFVLYIDKMLFFVGFFTGKMHPLFYQMLQHLFPILR